MHSPTRLSRIWGVILVMALVLVPAAYASSIGSRGLASQLGVRFDRAGVDTSLASGNSFEGTVIGADKLAQFGLRGLQAGDRVRVQTLPGNAISVTPLPSPNVKRKVPNASVTISHDGKGMLRR